VTQCDIVPVCARLGVSRPFFQRTSTKIHKMTSSPNAQRGFAFLFFILALVVFSTPTEAAGFVSRLLNLEESNEKAQQPGGTAHSNDDHGVLFARLSNNSSIPLIGVGVGNSPHAFVGAIVAEAIQDNKKIRLIDTAHKSNNEALVAQGILHGIERMKNVKKKVQIHVVTKVWYTHLGYERTKLAVQESMAVYRKVIESDKVDLKIHLLLHWPRCDHSVSWMECDQEEAGLPEDVRNAGPNPASDPDNAWKESWKLLEDVYLSNQYPIASIGVSNFNKEDLLAMHSFARIHPHVLQVNLWSLLYDAELVDYCHQQRIHLQVFNSMHGTVTRPKIAPRAYHHIQKVGSEIGDQIQDEVTPAQVIMAWLVQHGVSIVPRTSKLARLQENSAVELSLLPVMTDTQVETVAHAVEAYLSGDDLDGDIHVSVSFQAVSKDLMIYWVNSEGEEFRLAYVKQGESFNETTFPNHVYRTYDASDRDLPYSEHRVHANFGEKEILVV